MDIVREVMKHPECRGVHDLRTRQSGLNTFIQFHLVLNNTDRFFPTLIVTVLFNA